MTPSLGWGPTVALGAVLAMAIGLALLTGLCFAQPEQPTPNDRSVHAVMLQERAAR